MIKLCNQYVSWKTLLLVLMEQAEIALCFFAADWLRLGQIPSFARLGVTSVIIQLCLYCMDLYTLRGVLNPRRLAMHLAQALAVSALALTCTWYVLPAAWVGRGVFIITLFLVFAILFATRMALGRALFSRAIEQCVVIGSSPLAKALEHELRNRHDLNCHVTAHAEASPLALSTLRPSKIFIDSESQDMPMREFLELKIQGVHFENVQSALASLTGRIWLEYSTPSWLVFSGGFQRSKLSAVLKRMLDLFLAAVVVLLASPTMIVIAIATKLDSKGSIFYRQPRVGLNGRVFQLIKFRSMRADAERGGAPLWASTADPRATRTGRILRRLRLDELPQCFNILRGDMSFVGPRPERPEFVEILRDDNEHYHQRHTVRPGLTGWAQINYPYAASIEDSYRKLEYDLFYLKNMSFLFDLSIILKTLHAVTAGVANRPVSVETHLAVGSQN